jgi:hypothetical protein
VSSSAAVDGGAQTGTCTRARAPVSLARGWSLSKLDPVAYIDEGGALGALFDGRDERVGEAEFLGREQVGGRLERGEFRLDARVAQQGFHSFVRSECSKVEGEGVK